MSEDRLGVASLMTAVARDFLVDGAFEPFAWHEKGPPALADALALAAALDSLQPGLNELLLFSYDLEGAGDSPAAADILRQIIARSERALHELGLEKGRGLMRMLKQRGKQLAKERDLARPEQEKQSVGSILGQQRRIIQ